MPLAVKNQEQIKQDILRDIVNRLNNASVGPDSDFNIRATAEAAAIEGLYQYGSFILRQIFPHLAEPEYVAIHAELRAIRQKAATFAAGSILFRGTATSPIDAGVSAKRADGRIYATAAAGVIGGDGTATIAAQAQDAGLGGNAATGTALTLVTAPSGVLSQAEIVTMQGGTDTESNESLLNRLLDVLRNPPSSGNVADYKRWALEVDGCDGAYVYPMRRGLGTTDVIVTSGAGLPTIEIINAVQVNIDDKRPCGLNTLTTLAPAILAQDHVIEVALDGLTLVDATSLIQQALDAYYVDVVPGDRYVKSVVEGLITDIPGITDRNVIAPAGNVVPTVDATVVQWCRKGNVVVSVMP